MHKFLMCLSNDILIWPDTFLRVNTVFLDRDVVYNTWGVGVVADGRCSITSDEFQYKAHKGRAVAVHKHTQIMYAYFKKICIRTLYRREDK